MLYWIFTNEAKLIFFFIHFSWQHLATNYFSNLSSYKNTFIRVSVTYLRHIRFIFAGSYLHIFHLLKTLNKLKSIKF